MDSLFALLPAFTGAIVGGAIGYLSSHLQWKRTLKRERTTYDRENLRSLVEAAYAAIEFMRDYYSNSRSMEINAFKSCMTGKNPLKRILSLVVTSVPELRADAEALKVAMDSLLGPQYPVPEEKFRESIAVANEFGAKAYDLLRKRA